MNRLAVLLIGINVAALMFALGFAPRVGTCSWTTGDFIGQYVNCHQTDHVLPLMLGLAVLSAAYYYYRRPDPDAPRPAEEDQQP
jgi:uncharacterized membrane protein YfcA